MQRNSEYPLEPRKLSQGGLSDKYFELESFEGHRVKISDPESQGNPLRTHKKEESTSNTQAINDSSYDISPNSSGVMLLEQISEIKRLFEQQGRELENVGQAINTPAAEKMKEILANINREGSDSMMNSLYNQGSGIMFGESSRALISPVPNEYEGTAFASSLMSLSDYQVKVTEIRDEDESFLNFIRSKHKNLTFMQRIIFGSHIPGLRI